MAYKVYFDEEKPYAVADTIEEVAALLKLRSNGHSARPTSLGTATPLFEREDRVLHFFDEINDNARRLLVALLKHERGIRGERFAEETGLTSDKFGGIFGGASKIAKNLGLKIEQFVISDFVVKSSERYRFYKPGKLLLEYGDVLKKAEKEDISDSKIQ